MKKIALALLFTLHGLSASAEVITFDEVGTSYAIIPNGYAGFNWENFGFATGAVYFPTGSGVVPGTVSQPNIGYNGWDMPGSFSKTTPFELNSAYITKWSTAGLTHFDGYVAGVLTHSLDVYSTTTSPTFVTFNWANLDKVTMSDGDSGISPCFGCYPLNNSIIDNITINAVPEPETYALMLAGLGLVGFAARRNQAR